MLEINELLDTRSKALEIKAKTDPLTGAFNRLGIEEAISIGLQEWRKYHKPLSLVMIDIDHFKQVNDRHGHDTGDLVLSHLSNIVQQHTRTQDLFARWGGEEFLVVMSGAGAEETGVIAERLRAAIGERPIDLGQAKLPVTVSIGSALAVNTTDAEALIAAADAAMYRAKSLGRNRVEAATEADWRP